MPEQELGWFPQSVWNFMIWLWNVTCFDFQLLVGLFASTKDNTLMKCVHKDAQSMAPLNNLVN